MFQFDSLELLYWDCWERFRIPIDERVIVVTGPNGSGKTTLLDALRTLLATRTSEKRDYKKYVRRPNKPHSWVIGVVTNEKDKRGRPPFFPITTKKVTLACHINRKGGDWQRNYYILPGALSLEEIMARSEDTTDIFCKPRGVREYQVGLEKAGLSHAMLTVLALEQGATDKLCEYRPKELLRLVYAAFGDKPTLENYERALLDQIEAEKEMDTLRGKVDRLYNQYTALTNRVNNYKEYTGLVSRKNMLGTETMAQARYVDLYDGIKGASGNIVGVRRELAALIEKEKGLADKHNDMEREETDLKRVLESIDDALKEVRRNLIEENMKRSRIETRIDEIRRLKEECRCIEPEPLLPLKDNMDSIMRERYSLEARVDDWERRIKDLKDERYHLVNKRFRLDRPIEAFHKRLDDTGIPHTFLYENVGVTDEKWRVAIESILRGFRYAILLGNPEDRWRAWKAGEEEGYRHFIVGEKGGHGIRPPEGSALEVVRLSESVPGWIRSILADIHLVEDVEDGKRLPEGATFITGRGFIRERRGGRSIAVAGSDFAFGEIGRKKRLESLEKGLEELEREKTGFDKELTELNALISNLNERIGCQERLHRYLSRKDEEEELTSDLRDILRQIGEIEERDREVSQEKKTLEEKRIAVVREHSSIMRDMEQAGGELSRSSQNLNNQRQERAERYREMRKLRTSMPAGWRSPETLLRYREEFGGTKDVQREIERVDRRLQEGEWEKDPAIITLRDKVEKDYEGEKTNLELKDKEMSETRRVTLEARGAYIAYLRISIRFYEKNLNTLGEMAGVGIEVVKPPLENDDTVLREAGIDVRWNFDDKGFTSTDDGEGSGGQQVMKSLILLIALLMAEGDSGGFVFIDEPFAHLDVFNIDRVARFLLATDTQYIITSPNTHNTNVYRPAFLTIVTRKKTPDSPFADPPGHLRRMEKEDA